MTAIYKSISRRATRQQLLKIYREALRESSRRKFVAEYVTRSFRKWYNSHDRDADKLLISAYVKELFSEVEERMESVKSSLDEHGCLSPKPGTDGELD